MQYTLAQQIRINDAMKLGLPCKYITDPEYSPERLTTLIYAFIAGLSETEIAELANKSLSDCHLCIAYSMV